MYSLDSFALRQVARLRDTQYFAAGHEWLIECLEK